MNDKCAEDLISLFNAKSVFGAKLVWLLLREMNLL